MIKRAVLTVAGQVQQAGYRDEVGFIADSLGIVGTIKNLREEDKVEIVCEGEEEKIKEFKERIKIRKWPIYVKEIRERTDNATREFSSFTIIRDEDFQKEMYDRANTGVMYIRSLHDEMRKGFEKMDGNFNTMDSKYGSISSEIKGFREIMQEGNKSMKELTKGIQKNNDILTGTIIKLLKSRG